VIPTLTPVAIVLVFLYAEGSGGWIRTTDLRVMSPSL
jgi:hypothetical protein